MRAARAASPWSAPRTDRLREPAVANPYARTASYRSWPIARPGPDDAAIAAAADLLAQAERPIVMAGGAAPSEEAAAALARLQETAHLPVVTTNMGKGA